MPFSSIFLHLVYKVQIIAWSYLLLNSPGRSTSLAFACTVDSLRCWNQAGRGETIPTSCSSGLFEREIHKKRNCALVRYEELKQDQEKMVRKIADFIGYSLSEQQIQAKHVVAKFDPFQSSSLGHHYVYIKGAKRTVFDSSLGHFWAILNFSSQKLNEHMKFDNFQKASASNRANPNW